MFMASVNLFRYRGYYYDNETGFYYLQSRYYDPSLCRFISADQYELLPTLSRSLGELNLYSYCSNNPIMYTDESGEMVISIGFYIGSAILMSFFALFYVETTTHFISNFIAFIIDQIYDGISSFGSYVSAKNKGETEKKKTRIQILTLDLDKKNKDVS